MNFLLSFLPFLALAAQLLRESYHLEFVSFALLIAMLVVSTYSLWLYFRDRRHIRIIIRPAKAISWIELIIGIVATVLVMTLLVIQLNERKLQHQTRDHLDLWYFLVNFFTLLSFVLVITIMGYMKNPAKHNGELYRTYYVFLESGLKLKGLMRKIYPWNHFTAFDVDIEEHTIHLEFRNGEKLHLKIHKKDFDFQLPSIEIFLREKIASTSIPVSQ